MKKYFWEGWKNVTAQERLAIEATKEMIKYVLENIPRKEIVAIYMKGSFTRREMNERSDIDPTVILRTNRYQRKISKLGKELNRKIDFEINLGRLSLWEFEKGKRFGESKKPRGRPDIFLKKIHHYKLIYGKAINPSKYKIRDNKRALGGRIKTFRGLFIPMYERGEFGFQELIKQVFWLVETEMLFKEMKVPDTWKGMAKAIKDKEHIMHKSLYLRNNPKKDKKVRAEYLKALKNYLKDLDKLNEENKALN